LGIVRGHKGALRITSAPGEGTVFEVLFPAGESAPARTPPREETARGRGIILVVDDEPVVSNMSQRALARAGYETLLAANGAEALSVFARNASRISLVLLDLVMPVMSGAEVLPHLLTMKPELPVIVSSGHREEECRVRLKCPPVAGFLQKPYAASSLAAKVQEVLGAAALAGVEVGRVEMQ